MVPGGCRSGPGTAEVLSGVPSILLLCETRSDHLGRREEYGGNVHDVSREGVSGLVVRSPLVVNWTPITPSRFSQPVRVRTSGRRVGSRSVETKE